jgi:predicted extracellular nuclease
MLQYCLITIITVVLLFLQTCEQARNNAPSTSTEQAASNSAKKGKARVAFYNVENLYDTLDDTDRDDNQFLPTGEMQWTKERYDKKLKNIAKVLQGIGDGKSPDLVGLCEIENKLVLTDLVKTLGGGLEIAHFDSPDERGVDVALLYNPKIFNLSESKNLQVTFANDPKDRTRDILYVKGKINNDDLHLFVNHWPSRREGEEKSEPKRMTAAQIARTKIDEIYAQNPAAKILLMGDFNDEPDNKSMAGTLQAENKATQVNDKQLFNTSAALKQRGEGTLTHQGKWNLFDQIIVSGALLNSKKGLHAQASDSHIYKQDWMLYFDKKSNDKFPSRTYGGTKYYGDYSDHLPVYIDLSW